MLIAGNRCEYVDPRTGTRCVETTNLQAHHTETGNDDPHTGLVLCRPHHRLLDPHAR